MGLTRDFIWKAVDCPKCDATVGTPCRANSRNHFERMHKAQIEYPEEAGDYKPKSSFDNSRIEELKQGSAAITSVPCPVCNSGPGDSCVTHKGESMKGYHLSRVTSVEDSLSSRALSFYSYGKLTKCI